MAEKGDDEKKLEEGVASSEPIEEEPADGEAGEGAGGEGKGRKEKKRFSLHTLPLGLTPVLLGVALVALVSAAMSVLATLKANEYKARFGIVLRAARDPANFSHYEEANINLRSEKTFEPQTLTVVYGADLGHQWEMLRVLREDRVVNRSILGQNMTQLSIRFEQDVLGLEPREMVLLPPLRSVDKPRQLLVQIQVLAGTAEGLGIRPVLATIPPVPAELDTLPGGYRGRIMKLNRRISELAKTQDWPLLDLFSPLEGKRHYLREDFCGDGLWPNPHGFRVMTDALKMTVDSLRTLPALPGTGVSKALTRVDAD